MAGAGHREQARTHTASIPSPFTPHLRRMFCCCAQHALLKFWAEFVWNRTHRLAFDNNSANGVLMFKQTSEMITIIGLPLPPPPRGVHAASHMCATFRARCVCAWLISSNILLTRGRVWFRDARAGTFLLQSQLEAARSGGGGGLLSGRGAGGIDLYNARYKSISLVLTVLARCLGGSYIPFGVCSYYKDAALPNALGMAIKLALSIPRREVLVRESPVPPPHAAGCCVHEKGESMYLPSRDLDYYTLAGPGAPSHALIFGSVVIPSSSLRRPIRNSRSASSASSRPFSAHSAPLRCNSRARRSSRSWSASTRPSTPTV